MRLTRHTDYSLRVLLYLALRPDQLSSSTQISAAYGISQHHAAKVIGRLAELGYVQTTRGQGGGVRLAVDCADVRIGDVVERTEPDMALVECMGRRHVTGEMSGLGEGEDGEDRAPGGPGCPITPVCALKGALEEARDAFIAALNRYTLADVVSGDGREAVGELLGVTVEGVARAA